jgi:hypothetical protein
LWGTSYAGGHALVLGATDRRLRCIVAHVPTISGSPQGWRRVSPDATPALEHAFNEDERAQLRGEPPRRQAVVSGDPSVAAAYRSQDAIDFYLQPIPAGLGEMRSPCARRAGRAHVRTRHLDFCVSPNLLLHGCRVTR